MYSHKCERKLCPYRHSGGKTNTIKITKVDNVEESDMEDNDTSNEVKSFPTATLSVQTFL